MLPLPPEIHLFMLYQRHASPKSMHTSIKYALTLAMLSFVRRCQQLALECAIVLVCENIML